MEITCAFCMLSNQPLESVSYELIMEAYAHITALFKRKNNLGINRSSVGADNYPLMYPNANAVTRNVSIPNQTFESISNSSNQKRSFNGRNVNSNDNEDGLGEPVQDEGSTIDSSRDNLHHQAQNILIKIEDSSSQQPSALKKRKKNKQPSHHMVNLKVENSSSDLIFKQKILPKFRLKLPNNSDLIDENAHKFSCDYCDRWFTYQYTLNEHIRKFHSNDCFKCNVCHQFFVSQQQLNLHSVCHWGMTEQDM